VHVRPSTPAAVIEELADLIVERSAKRVLIDGAPAAEPARWADALVDPLRLRGRPVLRASAKDFLRPASLRLEFGRSMDSWYDLGALRRELLEPDEVLLRWWDEETDRSARAEYVKKPPGAVIVLDGSLLLGAGLTFELTVHLHLSEAALRRHADWALPDYLRYEPAADVVVMVDHPSRPAIARTPPRRGRCRGSGR
jgi:hypothetical protein